MNSDSMSARRSNPECLLFGAPIEPAKIWPNITVKKAPPPDWKEWEGKPDKLQYFSPKPGTGD